MRDGLMPTAMKASTPSFAHCLGKACFQSTKVAKTAFVSPFELLSSTDKILYLSLSGLHTGLGPAYLSCL